MREYDAYIFDLYGTLVDIHTDEYSPSFWKRVRDLFSSYGIFYDYRDLKKAYLDGIRRMEKEKTEAGHHIEIDLSDVFGMLMKDKGFDPDERTVVEVMEAFRKLSLTHLRLYKGTEDLLRSLKERGKKVFLLSNAQKVFTEKELIDLGIHDLFDDVFISSVVGYKKPDAAFYRVLLQKHELDPKDCLMIGNDPVCDVKGALDIGIDAYYIESGLSPKGIVCEESSYHMKGMDLRRLKKQLTLCGDKNV